ncbi:MAG: type IV toxin-antitoxin system AbiEi family antitoxin domain-containing protein [Pseudonocardiales bacterium]
MRSTPPSEVFSRAEALSYGCTGSALDRAVRSGRVHRLRRGQFTVAERAEHPRLVGVAAARACAGSVVSHRSAALLHRLPVLNHPRRPELTVAPMQTGDVAGALLHRATLRHIDVSEVDGALVTSVSRTLVDIGRSASAGCAVVAIDAALHRGAVDLGAIENVLCACWNWPGIRRAVRAVDRADASAESPLESISRLVIGWLGLPAPRLQAQLHDELGMFVGRADFYWPEYGVVGEADGLAKYDSRAVLLDEKRRQESLEALGLVVIRWDWSDVTRRPHLLRQRISWAFERGQRRDRSGLPRQWSVRVA